MIKRLLASMMSVLMIMTVFVAVPVSAETSLPANIGTDYVPGALTGNVLGESLSATTNNNNNGLKLEGETSASGDASFGADASYGYWMVALRDITHPYAAWTQVPGTDYYEWDGVSLNCYHPISGGSVSANWGEDADKRGNVVFAFKVNTHVATPVVNFVRANKTLGATNAAKVEYSVEYNNVSAGVTPTTQHGDGTVWVTNLTGTFVDSGTNADDYSYAIGLAMGTNKGATATISSDAYMGFEYAYDIKVTADKSQIVAGESVTVDADIVNQIGKTGSLEQNVTWYALNESRTAVAEGISVEAGSNGTATVTTTNAVATGIYYLVAVNNADSEMIKGVAIEVGNPDYSDHDPGAITGNVLGENLSAANNYGNNGLKLEGETNASTDAGFGSDSYGYYLQALRDIPHPYAAWTAVAGTDYYEWDGTGYKIYNAISGANVTADWGDDAGKCGNVVFAFKVNTYVDTPVVNFVRANNGMSDTNAAKVEYSLEYNNVSAGVTPTTQHGDGTVWETNLTGTFVNKDVAVDNYKYAIGLAMGTNKGATATISYDAYMGLEYAHDITVQADSTELNATNTSINIDYAVLNQIGKKGGINQDVEFLVTTPDRSTVLTDTGITILDNGDGTAQVKLNPFNADGGNYDIVVYSAEYGMAKGVSITVTESDVVSEFESFDFSADGNVASATLKILNKKETPVNAIMVLVMVNDKNKLYGIETKQIKDVDVSDGLKTFDIELDATAKGIDITKVTKAKVMVFDCGTSDEPSMFNTNMKEIVEGKTKDK